MKQFINKVFKSIGITIKDEAKEIRNLQITEEDKTQAEFLESAVNIAAARVGIYYPNALRPIVKDVIAIALRDGKDGLSSPSKLIISRLVNNYKRTQKNMKSYLCR